MEAEKGGNSADEVIVPTSCEDWSLNMDSEANKRFWWNSTYSLSVWEETMKAGDDVATLDDTDVWKKFIEFQRDCVYKICPICREPEGNEDMLICCYCAGTVHEQCSVEASTEQIAWKPANEGFEPLLRVCFECQNVKYDKKSTSAGKREPDNARRAAKRMLTLKSELTAATYEEMQKLFVRADRQEKDATTVMTDVQRVTRDFFQSSQSLTLLTKDKVASKGGGVGVVAKADIPAFTVIGVYPGYNDDMSGEQTKMGRPVPKYALMDLNCADYFNDVFVEFSGTFTPFINEPCESEISNCAWIQEPDRPSGRLSIISVKPIKKGEELLIGYGPVYPRDYPHCYDAYAFHPVEGYTDPICYALWHWPSTKEEDASFVCYVGRMKESERYIYWESEEEYERKLADEKKK